MSSVFRTLEDLGLRPWHRGKVRETCDLGDRLLIVTTDRISAFDCVLPDGLPGKGILLNGLSAFWLRGFARRMPTHFLSVEDADLPAEFEAYRAALAGRWMLVRKAERVPVECVVRGYLTGSGWTEYRSSGTVCGLPLPTGMREFDRLPAPLFTPTTKAEEGHDEPLTPAQTSDLVGKETAEALARFAVEVYRLGSEYALARGIIIADTKFEFGFIDGKLSLIDEVLTPDSSRFWPHESLEGGGPPDPLDKQYVRDYLKRLDWDRNPPAPSLPPEIAREALARYRRAYEVLTEGRVEPDSGSKPMIRVRRALLSAYHKDGLLPLARAAAAHGVELISSGGTAAYLREAGLAVTAVEEITGFGSLFGGRVKTLHPLIHGAILFRRDEADDRREAEEIGVEAIDLVVVNLYPFADARRRGAGEEETIELIDVGGPAMVRAAAKNHRFVAVVTQPEDYALVTEALTRGAGTLDESLARELAARAFRVTAEYDAAIAAWLEAGAPGPAADGLPELWTARAPRRRTLRYGENPSQLGGLYGAGDRFPFNLEQLHGKELSYNNYLDLACGRNVLAEFGPECVAVVIKHGIPCGTARAAALAEAYRRARDADALSAFGGVVCLNHEVDLATAELLNETFLEVVIAVGYTAEALALLRKKKNRALLRLPPEAWRRDAEELRGRFCGSGFLLQTPLPAGAGETDWEIATRRAPDAREAQDLLFGWKVLKHVRSNGILFAKEGRTIGVGSGQCSRIDSVEAAIRKANREGLDLAGGVMVSDAFFPFRDSVDRAHAAGITAVLQPGGSLRDEESVQACDEHGMAMAVNHARVFSHG